MAERRRDPALFFIPSNHAFADCLAAGLIGRFGRDPLTLANGRVLLPNNRAVRSLSDAFVRLSGGGLLLPRLVPIGDPDLGERVGGSIEPVDADAPPPAIDATERLLTLASILRATTGGSAAALRLAGDLARTIDALAIEEADARRLRDVVAVHEPGAQHWEKSLKQLDVILSAWPQLLSDRGAIDLTDRRNRLLALLERRWRDAPPAGFTVAAGITTAAPAVARLLACIARMEGGEVVLPGLWPKRIFPDDEWSALGIEEGQRDEPAHPQFHLKLLLDRMGMRRDDVEPWPWQAGPASPPERALAVANAMAAPNYSHKWIDLKPSERRLVGVRLAEFPDLAAEAQGIALALREALELPGKTAALVTADRGLAERVSALLVRWGIAADDSAGTPLSRTPPGTFILTLAALAAADFAPVELLAAIKHPLAGGEGEERRHWLDAARELDLALRGPRPPAGVMGLDRSLSKKSTAKAWGRIRPGVAGLDEVFEQPVELCALVAKLADCADVLSNGLAWRGQAGRMVADLLAELASTGKGVSLPVGPDDAVPMLRALLDGAVVRPAYGGHPRVSIWGLLEARLQHADLTILGGLNEGSWPPLSAPDPFLPPRIRADLGMPTLETRIGLTAQDFAHALGAPEVLVTRARRDSRAPTVASRFWLRLRAIDPDIENERELVMLASALDVPRDIDPADRPAPAPSAEIRPDEIRVTDVDLLRADPFSFYAKRILGLRALDPIDADATAAWKGTAVHKVFEEWLKQDKCAPATLMPRIAALLDDPTVHPLVRSLWRPRIEAAATWVEDEVARDRAIGRVPSRAEAEGKVPLAGVALIGKADRIDRLGDGSAAIVDYKTGHAPEDKVIDAGYALQLGLLALIAGKGGFEGGPVPPAILEYWSLAKDKRMKAFGYRADGAGSLDVGRFIAMTEAIFAEVAADYLTGTKEFKAKLVPERAVYGDYDQLMRLEEWYARL